MKEKKYEYEYEVEFQKRLKEQLRKHRNKKNLHYLDVANAIGKSYDTYYRWENTGQHLTDIFSLLSVFRTLDFSTSEIIDVLGLPPLTSCEAKTICQHEDMLESIKENGIYLAMCKKCPDMDDFTWGKLLVLLLEEYLKRLESRRRNP